MNQPTMRDLVTFGRRINTNHKLRNTAAEKSHQMKLHHLFKILGLSASALTLWSNTGHAAETKASRKPNIVLIFADDLGWRDVGYQGSDFIETPNIDRLAKEGMVFSSGYAAAGNCTPSRACLLSGNYAPRHHVYAVRTTDRGPKESQRLVPIPNKSGLPERVVTMADALKAAGYVTGHFGKWHISGKDGTTPEKQGFDVSFESMGGEEGEHAGSKKEEGSSSDPKSVFALTRKAGEFMAANRDKPFFCYLAHHGIHVPLQARPESLAKFQAKAAAAKHGDPMYAACTYDLDAGVGLLLEKIKELGLEENTLVVFTSDNGGMGRTSQEPLRGSKGSYYEGGIREPFLVRWPGITKPGSTCDAPVINVDLFPTFLAAADVPVPDGKVLDGESLLPLLKGEGVLARPSIFWHFPGYLDGPVNRGRDLDVRTGFRTRPVTVIRKGDWKLHLFHEEWQLDGGREAIATNNAVELYNIAKDIGERNNLANTETAKRDELLDELLAWWKSTDALVPTKENPDHGKASISPGKGQGGKKNRQKK
jgi:arylsulfatase A-like enzyme